MRMGASARSVRRLSRIRCSNLAYIAIGAFIGMAGWVIGVGCLRRVGILCSPFWDGLQALWAVPMGTILGPAVNR